LPSGISSASRKPENASETLIQHLHNIFELDPG
jgi:hypothetical protein